MIDELIATISTKLNITPDQAKAGLGIVLKFAKTELGPKFDMVESHVPGIDALIAAAPEAGGVAGALTGMLGGLGGMFGGGGSKLAGLAGLVGQAEQAGLNKDQLEGIGKQAVDFLPAKGGKSSEIAGMIQGLLP
jgi:hypothetical protein